MFPIAPVSHEEKLYSLSEERIFRRFSLAEIHVATLNFDDSLIIGKGGFGKVYKGWIYGTRDTTTARLVAIKRLDSFSTQGASEFMTEIEMLSKFRHCHLVCLIGYCSHSKEMILVYEYMPNGTIEQHLHKADSCLSWTHRLNISIGAARGLDYLHTGVGTQHGVIHRDVKTSNILLDENWAAKIADFGLSKIINQTSSGVITALKGTFGYLDPEYSMTGHLTRKSDVYAFGVVLFELVSGRRAVDTRFNEEEWNLANWAQRCVKERRIDQIVSSHILGQISPKCLKEFAQIAYRCLKTSRKERPTMAEVVVALQLSLALQEQYDTSQLADATGDPDIKSDDGHMEESFRIFSYSDMELATRNFSSDMLLGRGHYGEVFKGWLDKKTHSPSTSDSGLAISVRRLYANNHTPHKVNQILGYCVKEDMVLIVNEFMRQGTLKDYLFGDERRTEQSLLISRVKIAIDVARGLFFLHTQPQLAACTLQTHNILLDKEFNAKLSGFDVAMLVPSNDAPLYFHSSSSYHLKVKDDIYRFGVILMELLTGVPIANECDLMFIKDCLPGEYGFSMSSIYNALDCRIRLPFLQKRPAVQLAFLAQKCADEKSLTPPTLESVLKELKEIYAVMLELDNSGI